MHPQDEAKTAFITDSRTFCYKVMSFRLKSVRATCQHLVDKFFEEIIGIDVEVYVDDMMHQLKLNPEKCSFGVQAEKFLGFMLTEKGVKANPEKCQAIINMRSPRKQKASSKEKAT
ncbi:Retrovirus-related Pol polyprotein from transposon 17.6, partial [Mucuna pruriens]